MSGGKKDKLQFFGHLAVGILCPSLSKLLGFSWITSIATFVWLYVFLELSCRFRAKKDLAIIGITCVISYSLLYAGALGNTVASVLLITVFGLLFFSGFFISAAMMTRRNTFLSTLVFPAVWLIVYLIATLLRFPSLARVDMMFTDLTALTYSERLIGSVGLSCAILWIVSLTRFTVANHDSRSRAFIVALTLLLLVPGVIGLYPNVSAGATLRAAYTTGPYVGDFMNYTSVSYETNLASLEKSVRGAAEQNADILVFNEEAFEIPSTDESRFIEHSAALARENGVALLIGLDVTGGSENSRSVNKVVLIDSSGEILDSYAKSRLIPFIESDYAPGDGVIPSRTLELNGKTVKISYLICYDSNFSGYIRGIDPDTDILFLPSWDWSAVTALHAKICRALAVETGVSVLKPTYDGITVAIDPDGRVFHTSDTADTGFEQIHIVEMPIKSTYTAVPSGMLPPAIYCVIATEIMSVILCLMLLIMDSFKRGGREKTKRTQLFMLLIAVNIIGNFSDALSWILDGCPRLTSVLYVSTELSILMTILINGVYIAYITEYIREKKPLSSRYVSISWIYIGISMLLTIITTFTGDLFSFDNGVFRAGQLYPAYIVVNLFVMAMALVILCIYRGSLDLFDRITVYSYIIFPMCTAVISLFFQDWAFTYPAVTLSLLLIYLMIQSDRVERLEHEGQIVSHNATHDALTGLNNRRAFIDRVAELSGSEGTCHVVFSDLNGLKYANDNFGHAAGDHLLQRYARMLSGIFRTSEIFRISGDEFICVPENIPEDTFSARLAELRRQLNQDEQPLASIGEAHGPSRDIQTLIRAAESAMYTEKQAFHNKFPHTKR